MPNMSYCRFQNTCDDLDDCRNVMEGADEYYQSRKDFSSDECNAFERLVEICKHIVRMYDDDNHVFVDEDCDDS
jgi:hypothetical protein